MGIGTQIGHNTQPGETLGAFHGQTATMMIAAGRPA